MIGMRSMNGMAESYEWHFFWGGGGAIDEKVNTFIGAFNSMVETFFPESTSMRHIKDKPFITDKIKSLIVNRIKVYRSGKMELYRALRAEVSKEIKKAKYTLYDKVRPKRTACSKSWWKQIKRLTGKGKDDVTLLEPATKRELNNKESVTIINDFFADLTTDYPRINKEWFEVECSDSLPKVSVEDVQN